MDIRLPAEWEEQSAILLAWPHENTDWNNNLRQVEEVYLALVREISAYEKVVVASPDAKKTRSLLALSGMNMNNILVHTICTNDTWTRDYGPITMQYRLKKGGDGLFFLDFTFNGWGLKFPAGLDNLFTRELASKKEFRDIRMKTVGFVLEGGSIESDGSGTILTTERCLLSPNRNPHLDRPKIEKKLRKWLNAQRVLWLKHGFLQGDDTDAHIDTLARFCPGDAIAFVSCKDRSDAHYSELRKMRKELEKFRTPGGFRYHLVPLPLPEPVYDASGRRLPAAYANFLITNKSVLVPAYNSPSDAEAVSALRPLFPGREVKSIDCLPLAGQNGSLHCVTMQFPGGVL